MERKKERDDIMREDKDFNRESADINGKEADADTMRRSDGKTELSDFDVVSESIVKKIDEDAADVMEEAIKEIKADSSGMPDAENGFSPASDSRFNTSGRPETGTKSEYDFAAGTDKSGGGNIYGAGPSAPQNSDNKGGGNIPNSAQNGVWNGGQPYYGNAQGFQYQQGYNYNMPPCPPQNGAYNNQPVYNMPPNPYGYGQYGYYAPQYYQQSVQSGGYNYGQHTQHTQHGGMNSSQQPSGQSGWGGNSAGNAKQTGQNGQYMPNYQQGGWQNNYGGYNSQNVPPYYGYQYPYQPYGGYNQAYVAGYGANAAKAPTAGRGSAYPKKVKKQKPKNVGLRVFVCILAVVILAGIALTGAYFAFSPIDESVLDNTPSSSYSTGSSRLEASTAPEFSGGQNVDVPINSVPETEQMSTSEIAEKIIPSVVGIVVYSSESGSATSLATGIIITEDGYIVTNDHIYDSIPNAEFAVITSDNKRYDADFIAGDSRSDLAVLKMKGAGGLQYAEFGDSDKVKVGEEVVVIGNPYSMTLSGSVTKGIISATNRRITGNSTYTMKLIQTDAAINPGNSGGPLVNSYGQIIGINSSKIQQIGYEGIGFAIPSATVKSVVESLIEYGYVAGRAKLGLTFQVIDFLAAERNNLPQGLYVLSVSQESGLSGKISEGEVITHLDGVSLSETADFMDIIEAKKPGDALSVRVYNSGSNMYRDIEAVLTEDRGTSSYKVTY